MHSGKNNTDEKKIVSDDKFIPASADEPGAFAATIDTLPPAQVR